jgi:hypothetical protein
MPQAELLQADVANMTLVAVQATRDALMRGSPISASNARTVSTPFLVFTASTGSQYRQ